MFQQTNKVLTTKKYDQHPNTIRVPVRQIGLNHQKLWSAP